METHDLDQPTISLGLQVVSRVAFSSAHAESPKGSYCQNHHVPHSDEDVRP